LYDKVKHLKSGIFYTDKWDAFIEVLPPERHVIEPFAKLKNPHGSIYTNQ
jgi:IS1 family transposase